MAPRRRSHLEASLRLKPADPFELIRWLARSQSDPRKAVAELVQNSIDAGARHVAITRQRARGAVQLALRDDGEGILPAMAREQALTWLATHVGHSRKLELDAAERARRVIAGKYGVGLLGFWSIGRFLELRSRVAGSPLFALRLEEDSPGAEILRLPHRTDDPETFTEAAVIGVHPAALNVLSGRRLSDYLAAELRGQLLRSGVEITVHDAIARGLAQKRFTVTPLRFSGERLDLPGELEVPGQPPLRVELYLARGAERPAIQVACAGTLVADDVSELAALGIAAPPWTGCELSGLLEFAGFEVPPGTRRGVLTNAAAQAFVRALGRLAPLVFAELGRLESERTAASDRQVVKELKRALRGFGRRLPQYDLPRIRGHDQKDGELSPGAPLQGPSAGEEESAPVAEAVEGLPFEVGPLASVRIVPALVPVEAGGERRVQAVAADAAGRRLASVELAWSVDDPAGAGIAVRGEGTRPAVSAAATAPVGAEARLAVEARAGDRRETAAATVRVIAAGDDDEAALGIPEPVLVSDSDGRWRSRMQGEVWEVNDAHEDYRQLRADPRARVRYLLCLLAKEIVLRTTGRQESADVLESLVEILAHAERNLRGG